MRACRYPAQKVPRKHPSNARANRQSFLEPLEVRRLMATGYLDNTFDGDGRLVRPDAATGVAVVVQADGKIVTAGSADGPGGSDFFLARYNPDGSPDASFGAGGTVRTDFAARSDATASLALLPGGKIIAVGSSGRQFAAARYNADGSLDASFAPGGDDGDGRVSFGFGGITAAALDVAVQSDGRVVLSGGASPSIGASTFALARLNPDGTFDAGFGNGGRVTTGGGLTAAYGVAIGPGGKIVAGGTAEGGEGDSGIAVYRPDGSPDPNFGPEGDGVLLGAFDAAGDYDEIADVAVEPDGSILAAGNIATSGFRVVRFTPDGFLYHKFELPELYSGGNGAFAKAVATQADGKIVAAGYTTDDQDRPENFAVVRFNNDGSIDPTFSLSGAAVTDFRSDAPAGSSDPRDGATSLAISPTDGSIVVAGSSQGRSALARYSGTSDSAPPVSLIPTGLLMFGTFANDDVRLYPSDAAGGKFVADLNGALFLVHAAQAPRVSVIAGDGDDTVRALTAPAGNALAVPMDVRGDRGDDTIVGGAAGDVIRGGDGDDTLDGGRGADALLGGRGDDVLLASELPAGAGGAGTFADDYYSGDEGLDTIDYSARSTPVWVRLGTAASGTGGAAGQRERDIIRPDVETVVGGSGNDRLEGNDRDNTLVGGGGNDLLLGRGGNDTLLGGDGDDVLTDSSGRNALDGGAGFDTVNGVREQPAEVTLEAEDATLIGVSVGKSNPGYTGTGYADYNHATGDVVEWTYTSPAAGARTLTFRYANGGTTDRPLELKVNGVVINPRLSFAPTGSFSVWRTVTVTVQLSEGVNKIRLTSIGSNGANIDSLTIS